MNIEKEIILQKPDGALFAHCIKVKDIRDVYEKNGRYFVRYDRNIGTGGILIEVSPQSYEYALRIFKQLQQNPWWLPSWSSDNYGHSVSDKVDDGETAFVTFVPHRMFSDWALKPEVHNELEELIERVIFNPPVTVIIWKDGTKTMARPTKGDKFNEDTGFAMCVAKKFASRSQLLKMIRNAHRQENK